MNNDDEGNLLEWEPTILDCASPDEEGADTALLLPALGIWAVRPKEEGGEWETSLTELREEDDGGPDFGPSFEWRWISPNKNAAKRLAEDCERGGVAPAKAGRDPGCNCGATIAFTGGMGSAHLNWCASLRMP